MLAAGHHTVAVAFAASIRCSDILHELHQKGELKKLLEGVKQAED